MDSHKIVVLVVKSQRVHVILKLLRVGIRQSCKAKFLNGDCGYFDKIFLFHYLIGGEDAVRIC